MKIGQRVKFKRKRFAFYNYKLSLFTLRESILLSAWCDFDIDDTV